MVWIQIRVWVKTVCKGYQPTTKVATCRLSVNYYSDILLAFGSLQIVEINVVYSFYDLLYFESLGDFGNLDLIFKVTRVIIL